MQVWFRVDASMAIGTGHVVRCLTLADMLRDSGAECRFITRAHPGHMAGLIVARGFPVILLPTPQGPGPEGPPAHAAWAGVSWQRDAEETRAQIFDAGAEWLVLDHYAFDARWEDAACPTDVRLMVIDDLADRPHRAALLLDQNLGRSEADYEGLVPANCRLMIGPRHALLRRQFADLRDGALAARAGRPLRRLMVFMGGLDAADATSHVLNALRTAELPPDIEITVVMGSSAPMLNKVKALAAVMPRPTHVVVDVTDMAQLMANSDLAIGAAGTATWERCCMGLPSILVEVARNQLGAAQRIASAGAAIDSGYLSAPDFLERFHSSLKSAIERFRDLAEGVADICNGRGAWLIADQMFSWDSSNG